jgi:tRNA-specific 2-thiouridylase
MRLREVNWIGGTGDAAPAAMRTEVFVKVRSTRKPQAAWLIHDEGRFDVELIDGEDGVAPGQACVLYDAPDGQARVLGGGFIASAAPVTAGVPEVRRPSLARSP